MGPRWQYKQPRHANLSILPPIFSDPNILIELNCSESQILPLFCHFKFYPFGTREVDFHLYPSILTYSIYCMHMQMVKVNDIYAFSVCIVIGPL